MFLQDGRCNVITNVDVLFVYEKGTFLKLVKQIIRAWNVKIDTMWVFVQQKMIRGKLMQTITQQMLALHRRRRCKLAIVLRQQLFYRQQRRLFWILTKTNRLKLVYCLTATVNVLKKKIKFEESKNWSDFVKAFYIRRRSFERTWCRANLSKRKIKEDKHLHWSIVHSIYLLTYTIVTRNVSFRFLQLYLYQVY